MRQLVVASVVLASVFGAAPALAEEASAHTLAANVGFTNNYIFRGVSQSENGPALQGGFDYSHTSGLYLGTWASVISSKEYTGAEMEWDVYGGYKKAFGDFTVDVGLLQYLYPGKDSGAPDYDTLEAYIAGSWKWVSLKYSHTLTDYFGVKDTKGSGYLDLSADAPTGVAGLNVVAHVGRQSCGGEDKVCGFDNYVDYKLGATYAIKNYTLGLAYTGNDIDPAWVYDGEEVTKDAVVFSVVATF